MPAGVISYAIPAYPNVSEVAAGIISFLSQNISTEYVTSKIVGSSVPSWALEKSDEPISAYHSVSLVLSFKYHGTDFCLVSYVYQREGYQSQAKLRIYAKHPATGGVATELCCSINSGSMSIETLNFLVAQSNVYFVFRYIGTSTNYYYACFKIDAPTNASDTNAYVSVIPNSAYFTSAFAGEDLTKRAYLVSDIGEVSGYTMGSAYDSGFIRNLYNNKIPIYNVYAHSRIYGVRGKITSLAMLPNSYSTNSDNLYSINGIEYVGLGGLNGILGSSYRGILLRVV